MKGTTNGWGYYVPTQLYESLFLFALFAVMSLLYFKRCNITMSIYLIAYAVWRTFIEFFRTDYRGGSGIGLSPSQWQSVLFVVIGVAILLFFYWKKIPFKLKDDKENSVDKEKTE
jgi:prolipoprotein diacylglyceryltransferase